MVVHLLFARQVARRSCSSPTTPALEIKDALTRVDGVGSITVFGSRDYSMRVWLDPGPPAVARHDGAATSSPALQGQNIQVASGVLNQPPVDQPGAFQIAVQTLGRLADPDEFANIVVKQTPNAVVRLKDVAPRRAGRRWIIRRTPISISIRRSRSRYSSGPGSNALATATGDPHDDGRAAPSGSRRAQVRRSSTTRPSSSSSRSTRCMETILEAILLVVLVVVLFLQTWRAAIIPLVAIPVSLIGTFFLMAMFGFTLNNLSLFGLVLAVGIVVDDAIVVVENVERNIASGPDPARRGDPQHGRGRRGADRDRAGAVRGVRPVRLHHRHFRPVLPAIRADHRRRDGDLADRVADAVAGAVRAAAEAAPSARKRRAGGRGRMHGFFRCFNRGFDGLPHGYGWLAARVVRFAAIMLVVYAGIIALRPQRIPQDADRLHSAARPRLSHRRRAIAAGRVARAHRRGAAPRRRHRAEDAGRRGRGEYRRLLRRDLHQRAERRRDLPGARPVREARARIRTRSAAAIQRALFRQLAADPGGAGARGAAAAGARASAMPAASA